MFVDGEDLLNANMSYFYFDGEPIKAHIDGVSDISLVFQRFLNYAGNVLIRRLNSISKFVDRTGRVKELEKFINIVLAQIPDEFEPFDHFWVKGGLK